MSFGPEHKTCASCGSTFYRRKANTWVYWEKAKYCSRQCSADAWMILSAERRPSIENKFLSYVIRADLGCWSWSGPRDKDGYGVFFYEGKQYRAPVFALKMDNRPVSDGLYALHHCDNPECVRPDHLYVGTPQQNVDDMMRRGRANFYFGRSVS